MSGDNSLNPDPRKPSVSIESGDVTLYGCDCFINSAQMADAINATLYYNGNTQTLDAKPYSTEDYLDTVASSPESYKDYELALIEAIRDYGHFVQPMLSDANGWEIGKKYAYMHSDTTYSTTSIDLVSGAVSEHKIVRDTSSSGIDRVKLKDIAAHNLGDFYTVNVTAGGKFPVSVSALCYVNTVLALDKSAGETDDNEINGVVSLYRYYEATANYNKRGSE